MKEATTKSCQNCKVEFIIEPEDFEFYGKIDVPSPTFCPDCRAQRRLVTQNLYNLYKRKCEYSGKEVFSIYSSESKVKILEYKVWNSDKWDPMEYGKDYDFKKPFFEQIREMIQAVPRPNTLQLVSVNCDFCTVVSNSKNCYLACGNSCEDCMYFMIGYQPKSCVDCYFILKSELCYECMYCYQSYNLSFSMHADNCFDSAFLYNCKNCRNCFGCVNLKHKKYHIFNKAYSKQEYEKEMKKYNFGSRDVIEKVQKEFEKHRLKFPHRFANITKSENVTGHNVGNAKNCKYCFDSDYGIENCKYMFGSGVGIRDCYDVSDGGTNSQLLYEVSDVGGVGTKSGIGSNKTCFSENIFGSCQDVMYSMECHSCENIFGCIGLRHKKYCIFNKQYSKEEYEKLVKKIIGHMNDMPYIDKNGNVYRYGEFFPVEILPFAYNETIANDFFPLTKRQALKRGFRWHDKQKNEHVATIEAGDLPDDIRDVDDNVTKEIVECANDKGGPCQGVGVFKIIPTELEFYRKQKIALPRLCPSCRHANRAVRLSPMKLWKRQCMCDNKVFKNQQAHSHGDEPCENTFETTYAPERKEIVYCKECYQKEVE